VKRHGQNCFNPYNVGDGGVMKQTSTLRDDINHVIQILKEAGLVRGVVINQIKFFLKGNEKSHLYGKFANLYPHLWGKYPHLTNAEITHILNQQSHDPIKIKYQWFENVDQAKTFTEQDLENLTEWDKLPDELKKANIFCEDFINGRKIAFNSEPEWNTYTKIKAKGLIQSFRAQSLLIPYHSYLKSDRKYFPDFIFLTPEGYLAIVESKPIEFMANFFVQAKYLALKKFCIERGFIYAMFNENLISFEEIKQQEITNQVTKYFDHLLQTARCFNDQAFAFIKAKFKDTHSNVELKEITKKHIIRQQLVDRSSVGFDIKNLRKINYRLLEKGPLKSHKIDVRILENNMDTESENG
jgi:hypothetical protein